MNKVESIFTVNIKNNRGSVPVAWDITACVREFSGSVYMEKMGRRISANSMIGILSLAVTNGDNINVICYGDDEFSAKLCLEKIGNVLCR